MPSPPDIVPMPRWSTPVACIKLILAILILSFVPACIAILGALPAFDITVFTAAICLLTFGYYLVALSFSPGLYNKWVVLGLEALQMLLWFISAAMLAGWVVDSRHITHEEPRPTSVAGSGTPTDSSIPVSVVRRSLRHAPSRDASRYEVATVSMGGAGHGKSDAAVTIGGVATGFAAVLCILYVLTLYIYARNLTRQALEPSAPTPIPGSMPSIPNVRLSQTHSVPFLNRPLPPLPLRQQALSSPSISSYPPTPDPQATTFDSTSLHRPSHAGTSHDGSSSYPSQARYYIDPLSAAEAGIAPPTPVQRAIDAGTHINQSPIQERQHEYGPVSPMTPAGEERVMSLPDIKPIRPISFDATTHRLEI